MAGRSEKQPQSGDQNTKDRGGGLLHGDEALITLVVQSQTLLLLFDDCRGGDWGLERESLERMVFRGFRRGDF